MEGQVNARYVCKTCQRVFRLKKDLLRHAYIHKENPKYDCKTCGKRLTSKLGYDRHVGSHMKGKKVCFCKICEAPCANKSELEEHHRENHLEQKPFTCEICKAEFSWEENLHKHQRMHLVENYQCEVCNKVFVDTISLKVHMRIHDERIDSEDSAKPYACNICSLRFKYDFSYDAHMRLHDANQSKSINKTSTQSSITTPALTSAESLPSTLVQNKTSKPKCDKILQNTRVLPPLKHLKYSQPYPRITVLPKPSNMVSTPAKTITSRVRVRKIIPTKEEKSNKYSRFGDLSMITETPFKCSFCDRSFRWEVSLTVHEKEHEEGTKLTPADLRRRKRFAQERETRSQMQPRKRPVDLKKNRSQNRVISPKKSRLVCKRAGSDDEESGCDADISPVKADCRPGSSQIITIAPSETEVPSVTQADSMIGLINITPESDFSKEKDEVLNTRITQEPVQTEVINTSNNVVSAAYASVSEAQPVIQPDTVDTPRDLIKNESKVKTPKKPRRVNSKSLTPVRRSTRLKCNDSIDINKDNISQSFADLAEMAESTLQAAVASLNPGTPIEDNQCIVDEYESQQEVLDPKTGLLNVTDEKCDSKNQSFTEEDNTSVILTDRAHGPVIANIINDDQTVEQVEVVQCVEINKAHDLNSTSTEGVEESNREIISIRPVTRNPVGEVAVIGDECKQSFNESYQHNMYTSVCTQEQVSLFSNSSVPVKSENESERLIIDSFVSEPAISTEIVQLERSGTLVPNSEKSISQYDFTTLNAASIYESEISIPSQEESDFQKKSSVMQDHEIIKTSPSTVKEDSSMLPVFTLSDVITTTEPRTCEAVEDEIELIPIQGSMLAALQTLSPVRSRTADTQSVITSLADKLNFDTTTRNNNPEYNHSNTVTSVLQDVRTNTNEHNCNTQTSVPSIASNTNEQYGASGFLLPGTSVHDFEENKQTFIDVTSQNDSEIAAALSSISDSVQSKTIAQTSVSAPLQMFKEPPLIVRKNINDESITPSATVTLGSKFDGDATAMNAYYSDVSLFQPSNTTLSKASESTSVVKNLQQYTQSNYNNEYNTNVAKLPSSSQSIIQTLLPSFTQKANVSNAALQYEAVIKQIQEPGHRADPVKTSSHPVQPLKAVKSHMQAPSTHAILHSQQSEQVISKTSMAPPLKPRANVGKLTQGHSNAVKLLHSAKTQKSPVQKNLTIQNTPKLQIQNSKPMAQQNILQTPQQSPLILSNSTGLGAIQQSGGLQLINSQTGLQPIPSQPGLQILPNLQTVQTSTGIQIIQNTQQESLPTIPSASNQGNFQLIQTPTGLQMVPVQPTVPNLQSALPFIQAGYPQQNVGPISMINMNITNNVQTPIQQLPSNITGLPGNVQTMPAPQGLGANVLSNPINCLNQNGQLVAVTPLFQIPVNSLSQATQALQMQNVMPQNLTTLGPGLVQVPVHLQQQQQQQQTQHQGAQMQTLNMSTFAAAMSQQPGQGPLNMVCKQQTVQLQQNMPLQQQQATQIAQATQNAQIIQAAQLQSGTQISNTQLQHLQLQQNVRLQQMLQQSANLQGRGQAVLVQNCSTLDPAEEHIEVLHDDDSNQQIIQVN